MKPPLEETREYKLGRKGEILMHSFAIEYGCTAFDAAGTANGRAPLLHSKWKNSIAPDALHIRNYPLWAEYKTKTKIWQWNGGSRDMVDVMPTGGAHGIPQHAFPDYQKANDKMPMVLWFLAISEGVLHIASLDELGTPFPSVHKDWPMFNWPISRMFRVATFDQERLSRYFERLRPKHSGLPTADERKELLDWLRPRQLEFDGFIEHFLIWRERLWKP
jgi:hypothetical protein